MMKRVALTIVTVLGVGLTTLAIPNQYEDFSNDGEDMMLKFLIIASVALAVYGIVGYYVRKKKDKDDY